MCLSPVLIAPYTYRQRVPHLGSFCQRPLTSSSVSGSPAGSWGGPQQRRRRCRRGVGGLRIALAGLGMIGTSLALDLRPLGHEVWGWDPNPDHLTAARERDALDGALSGLGGNWDLILLAAPPKACVDLLDRDAVATLWMDVASVKAPIVAAAEARSLPLVGGHPLAGSARSGPLAAQPGLFRQRGFALCPAGGPLPQAIDLVESLGAHPIVLSADEHDRCVAGSSHLLYLLSAALAGRLADTPAGLLGPAAYEWLRLASSPAPLYQEILTLNQEQVAEALNSLLLEARRLLADREFDQAAELAQTMRERWEQGAS